MTLFEELKWRGIIKDISSPELEKKLNEEVVRENALAEIEKHFTDAMTVAKTAGIGIDELQEILKTLDEVGEV